MSDPSATPTVTADDYYAIIPEWVLDTASARAVQVYGFLRRYADKDSLQSKPSRATLAKRARCSRNTIDRALNELVDIGALTVTPRFDDHGDRTSNLYHLHRMPIGGPTSVTTPLPADGATPVPTSGAQNYSHSDPQSSELQLATITKLEHDAIWDTAAELYGKPSKTQTSLHAKLVNELVEYEATPTEMRRRSVLLVQDWGKKAATLASLTKWWYRYDGQVAQVTDTQVEESVREQTREERRAVMMAGIAAIVPLDPDSPQAIGKRKAASR